MILEIDSVELNFDQKKILYGIYLKGETGKVTGLLGPNGCGKTSLLRILFGDLQPKYKNIRINSKHQSKPLFKTNQIAYLPQHKLLPDAMSIKKAFLFFKVSWTGFIEHFETFAIHYNTKINKVSSGERRVMETYLILNSRNKILILDEPFSFITPIYVEKFKKLIQERKKDCLIIITDHFYRDILEVSDCLYYLKNGSAKKITSKQELEQEGYLTT